MSDKLKFNYFILGMFLGAGICFLVGGFLKLTEKVEPPHTISLRIPGADSKYYSLILDLPDDAIELESIDILEVWKGALELKHESLKAIVKGKREELKLLEERNDAMMLRLWDMERELGKLK